MKDNNVWVKNNEKQEKRTWLDLSSEELRRLSAKSACMYGRKSTTPIPPS